MMFYYKSSVARHLTLGIPQEREDPKQTKRKRGRSKFAFEWDLMGGGRRKFSGV